MRTISILFGFEKVHDLGEMGEMIILRRIETISLTSEVMYMADDCRVRLSGRSLRSRGRRDRC